jgi:hypothetical protein
MQDMLKVIFKSTGPLSCSREMELSNQVISRLFNLTVLTTCICRLKRHGKMIMKSVQVNIWKGMVLTSYNALFWNLPKTKKNNAKHQSETVMS